MYPTDISHCTYSTLVCGDASFIEAAGIPFVKLLDDSLPTDGISRNEPELDSALAINAHLRNDMAAIAGIIGVMLYFSSWITKKILDDIYTVKIQPKLKEILGQTDEQLSDANSRKKKMYQFGVWYAEQRVFILVGIVGDTFNDILEQCQLLTTVHANAVHWIKENGRQETIHLYIVQDGQVNIVPLLFEVLAKAHSHIDKLFPSTPFPEK